MVAPRITRDEMIARLGEIARQGWIPSLRPLNAGGIGNTIDARLGIAENNLPIADTAQWEIKTHRVGSASLLTLFHTEPEPRGQGWFPSYCCRCMAGLTSTPAGARRTELQADVKRPPAY